MAKRPEARRPGPRHGVLARPKHGTTRQGSGSCRPGPTTGPCLGLSTGMMGPWRQPLPLVPRRQHPLAAHGGALAKPPRPRGSGCLPLILHVHPLELEKTNLLLPGTLYPLQEIAREPTIVGEEIFWGAK
uniref:Uncharacterized protein n=1 Tax=Oryza sativa subsp. japonica TaxID=39947 RepID=Q8H901_ORYSJ|nr:unknown protein [Oryza sativa Japonica Group]